MYSTVKTLVLSLSIAIGAAAGLSTVARADMTSPKQMAEDINPAAAAELKEEMANPTEALVTEVIEETEVIEKTEVVTEMDAAGETEVVEETLVEATTDVETKTEVVTETEATEEMEAVVETEASEETDVVSETEVSEETIVDVAAGNDTFSILVAAVEAADLAETLAGEGPFTVFAPTNAAFEALPEGALEALLLPKNKELLVKILTYHVVSGKVTAADLVAGAVPTVEGSDVMVSLGDSVKVNNATVVLADVAASNGVIHAIDTVIIPPTLMSALGLSDTKI